MFLQLVALVFCTISLGVLLSLVNENVRDCEPMQWLGYLSAVYVMIFVVLLGLHVLRNELSVEAAPTGRPLPSLAIPGAHTAAPYILKRSNQHSEEGPMRGHPNGYTRFIDETVWLRKRMERKERLAALYRTCLYELGRMIDCPRRISIVRLAKVLSVDTYVMYELLYEYPHLGHLMNRHARVVGKSAVTLEKYRQAVSREARLETV